MRLAFRRLAILPVLLATPASAQQAPKPPPRAAPTPAPPPAIGCASLANYRILQRETPGAAALARLGDPKADHLGCTAIDRAQVTGLADHLVLAGQGYDCVAVQGTAICHWMAAGTVAPTEPGRSQVRPPAADKPRR